MKRLLFILLFVFTASLANAQIFNTITYNDKFDDVLKTQQRKTLITKTDSTFVIEEKGNKPVTYFILNIIEEGCRGSKDDIVNLVDNVYGYESAWCVVREDMVDKYAEAYRDYYFDSTPEKMNKLKEFWFFIVHRIVTTQYSGTFINEFYWLQDELNSDRLGKNVRRIIYFNI